ncbi:M15 family metallopeptidase [Mastigocoleus testarum]|uniref:D-alanyl-D-alanine carboxypeptidase n=1 Tax=Mastigocoleus testarum BC008 TaxID=371196 RepID=A0A0V7ZQ41_9CYAN|nr:M15 family metallopeptidase [Mastigocoleus testarum]KST66768.1 D-alanyl-D-alanine carboxypeptidase [Mastigocoleus testarum BC008]
MNNAGFPEEPENSSLGMDGDIPAALRDNPEQTSKIRLTPFLIISSFVGFLLLATVSGVWFFLVENNRNPQTVVESEVTPPVEDENPEDETNSDAILGHFSYPEAPPSELMPISADGRIKMRTSAAKRFKEMAAAARAQGVILAPLSGFRSEKDQDPLFFGTAARRNQTPSERAAVSAPPGHSEHHTGYAIDIGDGAVPATNLSTKFENTRAYKWLEANAAKYNFELSFPLNNSQGVSYEPWHWRFVGDRDSLETFYRARNLKPTPVSP